MDIKSKIVLFLSGLFSQEVILILLGASPIFELRLAIPVGILHFGMTWQKSYMLSVIGNILPILPLLLFLKYFFHKLEKVKYIGKLFTWWFTRAERKSDVVRKWGFWGMVLFVGIPLPVTGAWTGCMIATLLEMKTKRAFFAIAIGVSIAGLIITSLSTGLGRLWFMST